MGIYVCINALYIIVIKIYILYIYIYIGSFPNIVTLDICGGGGSESAF